MYMLCDCSLQKHLMDRGLVSRLSCLRFTDKVVLDMCVLLTNTYGNVHTYHHHNYYRELLLLPQLLILLLILLLLILIINKYISRLNGSVQGAATESHFTRT